MKKQFFKIFLPKKLLTRFILIILLPLMILQLLVGVYFYNKHWDTISRRLASDVVSEISLVATWLEKQDQAPKNLDLFSSSLGMDFVFKSGEKIPQKKMNKAIAAQKLRNEMKQIDFDVQSLTDKKSGQQHVYIQLTKGLLEVVIPQKRFFSSTVPSFLLWMLVSSFLLFGIAFIFMKNQVRAMVRLAKAAESFGMGQDIKFKPEGAEEVRQAGLSFIEMKERLARYLNERTTMLAGVSHDLRTPLTRMKLALSMMEPDETTQMLNQDILEMEHMLTGYLDFAKTDEKEKFQKVALSSVLENLVENFKRIDSQF